MDVAASTGPSGPASILRLDRTTTFLGEQLLRVQGKDVKDLSKAPVHQIAANECLFLPARNGQPFVRFETNDEDADGREEKLKAVVQWEPDKSNAFGTFDPLLSHWQLGETEQKLDLAGWKTLSGSNLAQSQFRVDGAKASARETPFPRLTASQLPTYAVKQLSFGADATALPKPVPSPGPR